MKTLNINTENQSKRNKTRVLVLFVLLVLSSMGVFGQENNCEQVATKIDFEIVNKCNEVYGIKVQSK